MRNGNNYRLSNSSLETIPEEGNDLPRISGLIPKSPETKKREQEYLSLSETHKQRIETFFEMLVVQRNLKRNYPNERYSMGNYEDYNNLNRSHSSPTMTWSLITEAIAWRSTSHSHTHQKYTANLCMDQIKNKLFFGMIARKSWQIWWISASFT